MDFTSICLSVFVEVASGFGLSVFNRCIIYMFISEDALYALKLSLNASPSQLTNWNKNLVDPCTWSNVECDQNNNVIRV